MVDEPLKLRGVSVTRNRLADGSVRFYYRHRKTGTMLGSSTDTNAVLRNYRRIERESGGRPRQSIMFSLRPRLVPADIAAQYCSVSLAEFEQRFEQQLHKHEIGGAMRYDLREVDRILDGGAAAVTPAPPRRASDQDDDRLFTRAEAAAWFRMSVSTFDRAVRSHLKECSLRRPGKAKGMIFFLLSDMKRIRARMFGEMVP